MFVTTAAFNPMSEAGAFAPVYEKLEELIAHWRASAPMKHSDLEDWLFTEMLEVGRRFYQAALDERGPGAVLQPVIDADGEVHTQQRLRSRWLLTLFGRVEVEREGYGKPGLKSLHPLDAELNLPPELYSHGVRRRAAEEAAKNSFDEVVISLGETTGAAAPKRQVEQLIERAAQDFEAFYEAQRAATPEEVAKSSGLLILTSDGKGVPMREADLRKATREAACARRPKFKHRRAKGEKPHTKRMATVASVYTIAQWVRRPEEVVREFGPVKAVQTPRPKPEDKRVWASLKQPPEEVIRQAFEEAARRDPERTKRWAAVVDGNPLQLGLLMVAAEEYGVELTIVLDLIHVIEYLWKAARAFYPAEAPQAELWVSERLLEIVRGRSSVVAAAIRRSATARDLSPKQRAPADKGADYLLKYADFLRYDEYLRAGLPIASGVIEGACRYVVKDRMEITGAGWSLDGAEAVLQMRALRASGDFDEYWKFHLEQEQKRHHTNHYAEGKVPLPPPNSDGGNLPHLRLIK